MRAGALLLLVPLASAPGVPYAALPAPFAQSLQKTRSMAEAQHEIAVLLITKGEYNKALEEAAKIFQMTWPADQEPVLLNELLFLADELLHNGQPDSGLVLIERVGGGFKAARSRIAIWKEKGYLHKELNHTDKALECFREAQRLEKAH